MSKQAQVLDALRLLIDAQGSFAAVTIGALPTENGLWLAVSTGRVSETTLAYGNMVALDVALNAKHDQQSTALETLCALHEALTSVAGLPVGEGWQMIAIRTNGAPGYLGREGGQWLYGSGLTVEYTTE